MRGQEKEARRNKARMPAFFFGLVLGGVAGAVTMWLMAPDTGEETRAQLYKGGDKLRHQAMDGMEEMVSGAGDKAHEFTDSVSRGVSELQSHAQDVIKEGKKA